MEQGTMMQFRCYNEQKRLKQVPSADLGLQEITSMSVGVTFLSIFWIWALAASLRLC